MIVRRLPAVEDLSVGTLIASDNTGPLVGLVGPIDAVREEVPEATEE